MFLESEFFKHLHCLCIRCIDHWMPTMLQYNGKRVWKVNQLAWCWYAAVANSNYLLSDTQSSVELNLCIMNNVISLRIYELLFFFLLFFSNGNCIQVETNIENVWFNANVSISFGLFATKKTVTPETFVQWFD